MKLPSSLIAVALVFVSNVSVADANKAKELGNKFLLAVGGEQVWANKKTVHNKAVNHHPAARLPYIQEQWFSLEEPAHVTKINNYDMQRKRSFTVKGGWSKTEKSLKEFSKDRLENEIQFWHKTLYRKLFLIATKSPKLKLEVNEQYLDFYEDENYLGWVILSDTGALLKAGGAKDRAASTSFGEMTSFGKLNWPRSGENTDGWRFEVLSFNLLEQEMPVDQSMPNK